MNKLFILLFSTFLFSSAFGDQFSKESHIIIEQFAAELTDWIGFNKTAVQVAEECGLSEHEQQLLKFHEQLVEVGTKFSKKHIQTIRSVLKSKTQLKDFFVCLLDKKITKNQFFQQKRRYKYLNQFINEHPSFAQEAFEKGDKPFDKGYRLGRFFKSFFQYYYLYILNPSETLSTTLIRTITVKSDIFGHQDISICLALETSGKISDNLENLSIQNIYIQIPAAFDALKYMKLKQKCRNDKYLKIVKEITSRLKNVDMFKIMYTEYTAYVEIAAEKYGNKQIQRIGEIFAHIINNAEHYEKYSLEQM